MNTFLKNKMPPLAQETENLNKPNKLKWYKNIPSKKRKKPKAWMDLHVHFN